MVCSFFYIPHKYLLLYDNNNNFNNNITIMAVYLKEFSTHQEYEAFTATTAFIKPNVSICTTEGDVHYNPYVEPVETRLVAKYNVTDTSNPTPIVYKSRISGFSVMEIDGVEQPSVVSAYTFSTTGEHTVKYTLTDPTSIGNSAFWDCSGLTSIDIPNSVTRIDGGAFGHCGSLTSCTIGSGVTSIGQSAFQGCSGLTSINIPSGVTSIGNETVFEKCSSLTSCTFAEGSQLTSIGNCTFRYCSGLTSINIPSGVTSIGRELFGHCGSLTSIDIPNSVTSIGTYAFAECTSLTSINIPSGVTSISKAVFQGCGGLTSIDIPSSVTSISNQAFENCSGLTSIVSNATIAPTIQSDTFQNVKTNGTLTVPSGSSGYDVWMGTGNYYLGKYNWTKVE